MVAGAELRHLTFTDLNRAKNVANIHAPQVQLWIRTTSLAQRISLRIHHKLILTHLRIKRKLYSP